VLLEGPHLVEEALSSGLTLDSVLVTPEFRGHPRAAAILSRLPRAPLEIEPALLEELADADSPRGILAAAVLRRLEVSELPLGEGALYLLADGIQEPGNLGAIARVAEAFGASALVLMPDCTHPNHPRALRASAGALLRLPVARSVELDRLEGRLAPLRPLWAGLVAHGGSPLPHRPLPRSLVLACGSEGAGLSPAVLDRLDQRWTIPLQGRAESLNVSVAVGIALFALRSAAQDPATGGASS